jgi:hypothetical protein
MSLTSEMLIVGWGGRVQSLVRELICPAPCSGLLPDRGVRGLIGELAGRLVRRLQMRLVVLAVLKVVVQCSPRRKGQGTH